MDKSTFLQTPVSLLIHASLGGITEEVSVKDDVWLGKDPSNAITNIRIDLNGIAPQYLAVQYNAHLSGHGDTGWLDAGADCNTNPSRQLLAIRIRLRGYFAPLCAIEYDARHTVAQQLLGYSNGELCGVLGISHSDAGGGPAWLYGLRVRLRRPSS